ncbi:hypothetical protein R3P38DRAFT_3206659 [Favolaschia claudopus]|uniref:Uncharacterized protein n=1 Tax=Favolaschia claudopus TaxID=2862362 RepID=A0AAW0ALD6_9AGAR
MPQSTAPTLENQSTAPQPPMAPPATLNPRKRRANAEDGPITIAPSPEKRQYRKESFGIH